VKNKNQLTLSVLTHQQVNYWQVFSNGTATCGQCQTLDIVVAATTHKQTLALLSQTLIEAGSVGRIQGVMTVSFILQ
jgi:hypothetical protein